MSLEEVDDVLNHSPRRQEDEVEPDRQMGRGGKGGEREKLERLWKSIMYLTFLSRLPSSPLLSGRWGRMRGVGEETEERVRWQDLIYK